MVRTGIQLYSLNEVDEPLPDLLERVADAGFDGVEFAYRVYDEDADEIAETLERTGLDVAGAHVQLDRLENDHEETLELFRSFGADTVTIPSSSGDYYQSRDSVAEAAERFEAIAEDVNAAGFDLLYHNHDHEFVDLDGEYALEALFEQTGDRVRPQIDVGLAAKGGADLSEFLGRFDDVPQGHMKDMDLETGESVPLGRGDVDLETSAEKLRENGAEWLIYEYEGEGVLESLDESADLLADLAE